MKKIFNHHIPSIIAALAFIFLAIIVGYYVWGIGYLVVQANEATNEKLGAPNNAGFDLDDAAKLDYRGMLPQTSVSSTAIVAASPSTSSSVGSSSPSSSVQ